MDVKKFLEARRSIRGFLPRPVEKDVVLDVLHVATRAPSGKNAQPWEFIVVAGNLLREIGEANVAKLRGGVTPTPDFSVEYPRGRFRYRSSEIAKLIYDAMDIPRNDKTKRQEWWELGYRYFNAPAAIFIHFGLDIEYEHALFDLGAITQSICLMALEKGLGTCIIRQGVVYPENIRVRVQIPPEHKLAIAIAIGYPDWSFPAIMLSAQEYQLKKLLRGTAFEIFDSKESFRLLLG